MSRIRDIVADAELHREEAPECDGTETIIGFTYAVRQKIPAALIETTQDVDGLLARSEKCLRSELLYALVGDIHKELEIMLIDVKLLARHMRPTTEAEEAWKAAVAELSGIIEGLEI